MYPIPTPMSIHWLTRSAINPKRPSKKALHGLSNGIATTTKLSEPTSVNSSTCTFQPCEQKPVSQPHMQHHTKVTHAMTVDVEDYYQVAAFANVIKPSEWK